jgi:hypothetical protein
MSQSQQSQRGKAPLKTAPILHSALSKRLTKRLTATRRSTPSPLSSPSSLLPSSSSCPLHTPYSRPQVYPNGDFAVLSTHFDVYFNRVSDSKGTLVASRLLYRLRHKSKLGSTHAIASIWNYGCELEYLEDDMVTVKRLWLCKQCHLAGVHGAA